MHQLFAIFLFLMCFKFVFEFVLEKLNQSSYENKEEQKKVCHKLGIDKTDFQKTLAYTRDKSAFGNLSSLINLVFLLGFTYLGGFSLLESFALSFSEKYSSTLFLNAQIIEGLAFFFLFSVLSTLVSIPFSYYSTFFLEEKHGFNKQSPTSFFSDLIKSSILGIILGGVLISLLLKAMTLGSLWWFFAWVLLSLFSLLTSWIYPSVLAPLFNKFSPIEDEELKKGIFDLAEKVDFKTSGIFIMDASTRSTHGNAYFTGVFGEKRIVLFDTLIKNLNSNQLVAVLAHELGHFKLKHVRYGLIRSLLMSLALFYTLSLCLPMEDFYTAFGFSKVSNYAGLVVFSMWFSLISFVISPLMSFLSRKNEFAADAFAVNVTGNQKDLGEALINLSKSNHSMPIAHPLYSLVYYSHPPLLERLEAMKFSL